MNELKMNIPTAQDARKTLEKGQYEKANKQAVEVESRINEAIAKGQHAISGDGGLEPSVKASLERLGYKYESGSQRNESYWSVSW